MGIRPTTYPNLTPAVKETVEKDSTEKAVEASHSTPETQERYLTCDATNTNQTWEFRGRQPIPYATCQAKANDKMPPCKPGDLIVKYDAALSNDEIANLNEYLGVEIAKSWTFIGAHLLTLPAEMSVEDALEIFSGMPDDVVFAEPVTYLKAD